MLFISTVGTDLPSNLIKQHFKEIGLRHELRESNKNTATYSSIESQKDLIIAIADMDIIEEELTFSWILENHGNHLKKAKLVALDGNLHPTEFKALVDYLHTNSIPSNLAFGSFYFVFELTVFSMKQNSCI